MMSLVDLSKMASKVSKQARSHCRVSLMDQVKWYKGPTVVFGLSLKDQEALQITRI